MINLIWLNGNNSAFKFFPFRDLSNNSLNGHLPNFLTDLQSLKVL